MSKKALITGVTGQDGSFFWTRAMRYTAWCAVPPQRRESVSTI